LRAKQEGESTVNVRLTSFSLPSCPHLSELPLLFRRKLCGDITLELDSELSKLALERMPDNRELANGTGTGLIWLKRSAQVAIRGAELLPQRKGRLPMLLKQIPYVIDLRIG